MMGESNLLNYDDIIPSTAKINYAKEYLKAYQKSEKYKAYRKAYYLRNREKILSKLKQKRRGVRMGRSEG